MVRKPGSHFQHCCAISWHFLLICWGNRNDLREITTFVWKTKKNSRMRYTNSIVDRLVVQYTYETTRYWHMITKQQRTFTCVCRYTSEKVVRIMRHCLTLTNNISRSWFLDFYFIIVQCVSFYQWLFHQQSL